MDQAKQKSSYSIKVDQSGTPQALMTELSHAIRSNELVAYYQPKVDIKTGVVRELEALVRWNHQAHGLMSPDKFILLAEQTGLIKPLTLWVLHESIMQCAKWNNEGFRFGVAVNLSTSDLLDAGFPDTVARALNTHKVSPEKLLFEITESALMKDTNRTLEVLNHLASIGVRLSIDDYGTGSSSQSFLSELPLKELKIDISFVADMGITNNMQIVRSAIDLGHSLGLEVVAEGVANAWILSVLKPLGCDAVQGYYFSRPREAQEFTTWIERAIAKGRMQCKGGKLYMMLPQKE